MQITHYKLHIEQRTCCKIGLWLKLINKVIWNNACGCTYPMTINKQTFHVFLLNNLEDKHSFPINHSTISHMQTNKSQGDITKNDFWRRFLHQITLYFTKDWSVLVSCVIENRSIHGCEWKFLSEELRSNITMYMEVRVKYHPNLTVFTAFRSSFFRRLWEKWWVWIPRPYSLATGSV